MLHCVQQHQKIREVNKKAFLKKNFIRKQYSAAQKVKNVEYWIFEALRKFFTVYVLEIRYFCGQNIMYVTLATL